MLATLEASCDTCKAHKSCFGWLFSSTMPVSVAAMEANETDAPSLHISNGCGDAEVAEARYNQCMEGVGVSDEDFLPLQSNSIHA